MIKLLWLKLKESLISVLPVALIVIILSFTPLVNFTQKELVVFIISSLILIVGIGLFNLGADIAMTPMGEQVGSGLVKKNNLKLLLLISLILGILITVAEPDLSVLASQVSAVINPTLLIVIIGVGVGLFLALAVLKMIYKKSLSMILIFFYFLLFALTSLVIITNSEPLLPLAFDSGGVTTGPITVPFIMALGVGIATTLGGRNAQENSFGLIALCSVGPILAVMLLGTVVDGSIPYTVPSYEISTNIVASFFSSMWGVIKEVALALGLVVVSFIIINFIFLHLHKKSLKRIAVGVIYTFVGLVLFLTAVSIGFMPIGFKLGKELASKGPAIVVLFGFILGLVVVLAEPAVHVLNKQVENVTNGTVSKRSMMVALSLGVGISIGLSMLRIVYDFSILYYMIPGYFLSLGLSFFVPSLYTAIAFDSGGVASGPLTSSFILPLAIGACVVLQGEGSILSDAFGIVAMVAMTPLITIQILGFRAIVAKQAREKIAMRRVLNADDKQIIHFD